ncbi:MAG: carboxypeptidase M32 [Nanoarchaeota archaeon]
MSIQKNLEIINHHQKEIILLNQIGGLLGWDQQTYMPPEASIGRAEQEAFVSSLVHKKMIADEFFNAVIALQKEKLDARTTRLVTKLHKDLSKSRKLPLTFVEELSKTTSLAFDAWQEARKKQDFTIFKPHLEKIVTLKQKQATYISPSSVSYDMLIDDFEEGMTVAKLEPLFEQLKEGLLEILTNIEKSKLYKNQKEILLQKSFPKNDQIYFCEDVFRRIGLSTDSSRIDFAQHPFETSLGFNDIRITTNIRNSPLFSFFSTVHEAGHALYELDLSEKKIYDFLQNAPSYGLHESQSRFWELFIAKNKFFWQYYFPLFKRKFKLSGTRQDWYREIHFIAPSLIRIESDEVHYCMHIILRFEIEKGLLDGSIRVADLPKIWNEKMKKYLGIVPKNDAEGVLQDVHWSSGSFGYFPSYALGTLYAAQLYSALQKQIPSIEKDIVRGDFIGIQKWLKEKVHAFGAFFTADDLIKKVTGEGLNPSVFLNHLREKYGKLYGF